MPWGLLGFPLFKLIRMDAVAPPHWVTLFFFRIPVFFLYESTSTSTYLLTLSYTEEPINPVSTMTCGFARVGFR